MVALLITVVVVFGLMTTADAVGADSVGFLIAVTLMGFGFAFFVGEPLQRATPRSLWDRLSLPRGTARRWGVTLFNAFLSRIGWNTLIFALREDTASGAGDRWDPRHMKAAAAGHAWAFLLHVVTAIWAAAASGWVIGLVLLTIGIIGHLYPVLLQVHVLTLWRQRQGCPL